MECMNVVMSVIFKFSNQYIFKLYYFYQVKIVQWDPTVLVKQLIYS